MSSPTHALGHAMGHCLLLQEGPSADALEIPVESTAVSVEESTLSQELCLCISITHSSDSGRNLFRSSFACRPSGWVIALTRLKSNNLSCV